MRLINDPGRRQRLGLAARKRIFHEHTLERFSEYFEKMILGDDVEQDRKIRVEG